MCMLVYIASDSPVRLIPWDPNDRGFHLQEPSGERDESVRRQFSKPFVYYAGSHLGCGCGFEYGQWEDPEEDEDERRKSVADLSRYLADAVKEQGAVELFACWDGDQAEKPESRETITPEWIGGERFRFKEKQFFVVQP